MEKVNGYLAEKQLCNRLEEACTTRIVNIRRDVKPDNMLLKDDSTTLKLADFNRVSDFAIANSSRGPFSVGGLPPPHTPWVAVGGLRPPTPLQNVGLRPP